MKLFEISNYLDTRVPLALQEEYDNCGLLIGDKKAKINSVLICLDCTEEVINEAIKKKHNLIISHHPILFHGLKKITGSNYVEKIIEKAIKNNIAIYAMHTNLDNVHNGVSAKIAEKLGLENCRVLAPKSDLLRQLVVYCPAKSVDKVKTALFDNGAGTIGDYDQCSFISIGRGTFNANANSNPFVGKIGKLHIEDESRIEVIYPKYKEKAILNAMNIAHPYEEVAHQIYVLENQHQLVGSGIVGELKKAIRIETFLKHIKSNIKANCIRYSPLVKNKVKRVAVCGGSGSFLLENAKAVGSDIFITADFKYHEFFDADNEIVIADIGHYESEQFTKDLIYDLLTKNFTKFAVQLSKVNTNPIKYL